MPPTPPTPFQRAAGPEVTYAGEHPAGIHVYVQRKAMSRVRAYQTAGLQPVGGRGSPTEDLLVGHVHVDATGKVLVVEGFNGQSGERFAQHARSVFSETGLLADGARVEPTKALRACPATGFR